MKVTIVDYGSGNLRSVAKSFEKVAAGKGEICVSSNPRDIETASHIVLPGVGAFADCMNGLQSAPGLKDAVFEQVRIQKKPFLGICVGMQLLASTGLEHGTHAGLGWIPGDVLPISPGKEKLKIPHMGWNTLTIREESHPIMKGIKDGSHAYFVHSFYFSCRDKGDIIADVEYGAPLAAIIGRENMVATQFHPEKSQETGLTFLRNFLIWKP